VPFVDIDGFSADASNSEYIGIALFGSVIPSFPKMSNLYHSGPLGPSGW
jgi:hypothetical protein